MSAAIAKTTLGPAPWPAKPRRVPKVYETIKLESLSLTDDKMTAKRAKAGSKYDALFRAALDTGKAIKTPGGAAASVGNIARTWLARQGITGYVPRTVGNYGDGAGRVWLMKVDDADTTAQPAKRAEKKNKGGAA